MDTIVYTCVTDKYDDALMAAPSEIGTAFVCFTDQPGRMVTPGWEVRPLNSPPALTRGHDINRYHKFFPHHLFPDARWSVYLDGNVRFDGRVADLVRAVRDYEAEIGAFTHPHAHSLRKEAEVCSLSKFDAWDFGRVEEQLAAYAGDGIDLDAPIPACYILVRDHASPRLARAMTLWWSQIFEYTKRDQMSFKWAIAQSGLKLQLFDNDSGIDPALVDRTSHSKRPLWERIAKRTREILKAGS